MDIKILNKQLIPEAVIDTYTSIIWTDRYNLCGDFEVTVPANEYYLSFFNIGDYIVCDESEHVMIIEKIQIKSEPEEGNTMIISGRSIESILDRRIIWGQVNFNGNVEEVIFKMLNICLGGEASDERKIPIISFKSANDAYISSLRVDLQCTGDGLYETISKITKSLNLGFKMVLDNNMFVFSLYNGANHSENQLVNPYVIFSPNFDNMLNSIFMEDISPLKTAALIGGEGEGSERRYMEVKASPEGLNRREMFVDARDITSRIDGDHSLSAEEYNKLLTQRGLLKLTEKKVGMNFEGKIESSTLFVYGKDYNIGDIVQIENSYGYKTGARITEAVISYSSEGFSIYPTLQTII